MLIVRLHIRVADIPDSLIAYTELRYPPNHLALKPGTWYDSSHECTTLELFPDIEDRGTACIPGLGEFDIGECFNVAISTKTDPSDGTQQFHSVLVPSFPPRVDPPHSSRRH